MKALAPALEESEEWIVLETNVAHCHCTQCLVELEKSHLFRNDRNTFFYTSPACFEFVGMSTILAPVNTV
jgi:hypothetical protein